MSVRRSYELLLDHDSIFEGSYKSVLSCYSCVVNVLDKLGILNDHVVSVSFHPVVNKKGD